MSLWLTCGANIDSSHIDWTPSSCRRIRSSLRRFADIVILYLAPPAAVVVLCVDEKSEVQALDRTQSLLPDADCVRNGTCTSMRCDGLAGQRVRGTASTRLVMPELDTMRVK